MEKGSISTIIGYGLIVPKENIKLYLIVNCVICSIGCQVNILELLLYCYLGSVRYLVTRFMVFIRDLYSY